MVAKLRGKLGIKKIGHAGTLDPLAEGVLVVLTQEDTKRQKEFMEMNKEYIAEIVFGVESPTYDLEMVPVFSGSKLSLEDLSRRLNSALPKYKGKFPQKAPPYSAKKVHGKPLYKIYRKGKSVNDEALPVKEVEITRLEVMDTFVKKIKTDQGELDLPVVRLKIACSSGTYIRSLAHDLGKDLGTSATLSNLVRTRIGDYTIDQSEHLV